MLVFEKPQIAKLELFPNCFVLKTETNITIVLRQKYMVNRHKYKIGFPKSIAKVTSIYEGKCNVVTAFTVILDVSATASD